MEKFDIPRTIRRVAPKHAAPAGVFRNSQQLAFSAVTNISVTGACIAVASPLAPGSDVDLTLSFYQQPRLYEIAARVVWNRRGGTGDEGFEGLQLHGVQFKFSSALQKSRLSTILDGEDFVDIYRVGRVRRDALQMALSGELNELVLVELILVELKKLAEKKLSA